MREPRTVRSRCDWGLGLERAKEAEETEDGDFVKEFGS